MASIQLQSQHKSQQSKETVQINPDSTILIDGQKQECSQQACQSKQASATVRKVQMPDGNTQIQLSTKVRILYYFQVRLTVPTRQRSVLFSFWLFDIFSKTFWWLSFKLLNQNARSERGGVAKRHGFSTTGNSASHSPCILIGQMQRETIRNLSKSCQKLIKNVLSGDLS